MQGSFNGTIRQYFTVTDSNSWYKTITTQALIADNYAALASQFLDCRVHSLNIYYEPNAATSKSGNYAACLIDADAASATALSYGRILANPGSVVRKAYQSFGLHWKWTEPSDAEFRRIDDNTYPWCVFQMATNDPNSAVKLGGDLIVDASITLRNQLQSVSDQLHSHFTNVDLSLVSLEHLHYMEDSINAELAKRVQVSL